MKSRKPLFVVLIICSMLLCATLSFTAGEKKGREEMETVPGYSPNPAYEYLVAAEIYQLSAETSGLMIEAFNTAREQVEKMLLSCADPAQPDWQLLQNENGEPEMYYQGKRAALIADIDDTLVNGACYSADVLGEDGDWNNVSFTRFLMSEQCTALPGALEFIRFAYDSGIEVFYLSNRYNQGYKIGQQDSKGSYDEVITTCGAGAYKSASGEEIGVSIYQIFGKSIYDITLESMEQLGFPVDDRHLLINDRKVTGTTKEPARQAIQNGCTCFPNGVVPAENVRGCVDSVSCDEHAVVMMLGDQMTDFTDRFDGEGMDAVTRAEAVIEEKEKLGKEWILLPNGVYGTFLDNAKEYGVRELFRHYSYMR